jgi:hypothetical protein
MAYLGVRRKSNDLTFIIKVHGPVEKFSITPQELKHWSDIVILNNTDTLLSDLPRVLADTLCDIFCNDSDIMWVEVELHTTNDVLFSASAERIGV